MLLRFHTLEAMAPGIGVFLGRYAGMSFNQGLPPHSLHQRNAPMDSNRRRCLPGLPKRSFLLFSTTGWEGTLPLTPADVRRGSAQILMLEPGTGQSLEIQATFNDFHDVELVEYQNEALAADFYRGYRLNAGGAVPDPSQCIGYRKPLFLGGEDVVGNLELTDMDVYWSISGQLLSKIRGLPARNEDRRYSHQVAGLPMMALLST